MSKNEASEAARIKAWKAERARIAAADKAARVQQRKDALAEAAEAAKEDRQTAAISFLKTVPTDDGPAPDMPPAPPKPPSMLGKGLAKLRNLSLFTGMVVAPVLAVGFYLTAIATPLYEAQAVIAITKSSDAGSGSRSGLLGSLDKPSNLPEIFRADTYIKSQALMDSLEAELGLVTEFSGPAIDPVRRLRTIPFLSLSKHMQFDRFVESSIDIQSGLLTLYVRAPSEEQAIGVSQSILRNAEIQVSKLGQILFDNRQSHAAEVRDSAEKQAADAQAALVELQFKYQEVDPKNRVENIYARIKEQENEVQRLNQEIQKAQIAGVGDSLQTEKLIALRDHIRDDVSQQRAQLVASDGSDTVPLNNLLMEYELANLDVELAREAVKTAIEAQAEAGREAALNRSLFQVVVPPRTAQTAIYPKIPGTLALVFIICLAGYAAVTTFRPSRN